MQSIRPLQRLFQWPFSRVQSSQPPPRSADVWFWLGFIAINGALFLPAYLLNAETTTLWPATGAETWQSFLFRVFIWRENLDIFRVNLEVTLMVAAWLYVTRLRRPSIKIFFSLFYLLILCYYIYEGAMLYLYRANPVFFSDYFLARDGLGFLIENARFTGAQLGLAAGILVGGLLLLMAGFRRTLRHASASGLSRASRLTAGAFAVGGIALALLYQSILAHPMMVTSSAAYKIAENIAASVTSYRNLLRFGDLEMRDIYDYRGFDLEHKPDIYLIFIESYGSVLYKRPDYRMQYANLSARIRRELAEDGWHVATALSDSPTWGGGSWLAYTSTLFGLHIENHPQFLTLLDKYSLGDERYPHLPGYLQTQGYQFVWLSSLADQLGEQQWNRYRRFYGFDRLLRYRDLDYTGPHYGWGPSPPDQFALSFANANAIEPADQPTVLFFITQNAHFPWAPIPPLLDDWRDFLTMPPEDDPEPVDLIEHDALRARYMAAIVYSLEMLVDYIRRQGSPDALYIVLGDHQPPRVSRRSDGYDAPLHIISRDAGLIDGLSQYGFAVDTLFLQDPIPALRHEGIYSLLVRHLIEYYGTDNSVLPRYHPEGVTLLEHLGDEMEIDIEGGND